MTSRRVLVLTLFVLCAMVATANAQASRTWVSGVGDDANPCSRTAPCKTFAGAISKTGAGGVISVLDPGGYGAVTITKSITIDGSAVSGSVLVSGTNGIVVSGLAATDVVILRNITIEGIGTGIAGVTLSSGSILGLYLENCVISAFTGRGIDFRPVSGTLYVTNSRINSVRAAGVYVSGAQAVLDNVNIGGSTIGVRALNSAFVTIRRSAISGSASIGVLSETSAFVVLNDSTVSFDATGLSATGSATIVASGSSFLGSATIGLSTDGTGRLLTTGTNTLANNVDGAFTGTMSPQ